MQEQTITRIDELHEIRRTHWDRHMLYRGESSSSNTLRPKFGRWLDAATSADPPNKFPTLISEQHMLEEFKRRAYPYLPYQPADDWDWLAIAQHHGLSTRLLDWSTNILVAAYFSCAKRQKHDGAIYAVESTPLPDAPLSASPFSLEHDVIFYPRHSNNRIVAQSGLFISHAKPSSPFQHSTLWKYVIPRALLIDLETTLRTYDICRSRLFPGLDSLADHLNESYGCF